MSQPNTLCYQVESFDEAVVRLTQLRKAARPTPAKIEFAFSVEGLPSDLLAEFCKEAGALGLEVSIAA